MITRKVLYRFSKLTFNHNTLGEACDKLCDMHFKRNGNLGQCSQSSDFHLKRNLNWNYIREIDQT